MFARSPCAVLMPSVDEKCPLLISGAQRLLRPDIVASGRCSEWIVGHSENYVAATSWSLTTKYRYVWSAARLQAKTEIDSLVCANVFGLWWSARLLAMMDSARSLPY